MNSGATRRVDNQNIQLNQNNLKHLDICSQAMNVLREGTRGISDIGFHNRALKRAPQFQQKLPSYGILHYMVIGMHILCRMRTFCFGMVEIFL